MLFKRTIPLILLFLVGLSGFTAAFIPHPVSDDYTELITTWARIIGGFGLFLGSYSLLHMHVTRIRRKAPGWGYSAFVFIGAAGMIALGLWNDGMGPFKDGEPGQRTAFQWSYDYIQVPCTATIFSILAFFMASAAFRTFRAKNTGAALLLLAAILVMFGRVPVSETIGGWFHMPHAFGRIAGALMDYPNVAAQRAVLLGVSLGAIAQSIRILFGIERSYLGGSGE